MGNVSAARDVTQAPPAQVTILETSSEPCKTFQRGAEPAETAPGWGTEQLPTIR
jgi:hypothetical protein